MDRSDCVGARRALRLQPWTVRMTVIVLMTVLSGCSVANQLNPLAGMSSLWPGTPPEQVVGPDSAFTLRTPPLLTPGAKVSTKHSRHGVWVASFSDDLCRAFVVTVSIDSSTLALEEKVRTRAVPQYQELGAVDLVQRVDTLDQVGQAIFVKYRVPNGAPCRVDQVSGSMNPQRKSVQPDAEIAHYEFQHGALMFDVLYGRAFFDSSSGQRDPYGEFMRVGPAEALLRDFVAGIVFLR